MRLARTGLTPLLALMSWSVAAQNPQVEGWTDAGHVVVLGADSNRVYLGVSRAEISLETAMQETWTVHSAPRTGGLMVEESLRPLQVDAWESLGDIQHVSVHPNGQKALVSARRNGGDFDVFLSHRTPSRLRGGRDIWTTPVPLDGLNSERDEVFPQWDGQDIRFASNRKGSFALYRARAVLQYLRAEPAANALSAAGDVLSAVTVGPAFTWVSRRNGKDGQVEVVRAAWPEVESPLPEGWTVCLLVDGRPAGQEVLTVREVETRNVTDQLPTGADGCASLDGLPANQAWTFQWEAVRDEVQEAVAEVRSPDGRVVRRYLLNAENGFAFVFLPLDPVSELAQRGMGDGSVWPESGLAVLHFDHGSKTPTEASWRAFLDWEPVGHRHGRGRWDVVGHTDNSGSREANAALSLARAQWVSQHLVDALGWKAEDVVARGLGSTEPMGTNPAQNRRVEVRWVPSLQ